MTLTRRRTLSSPTFLTSLGTHIGDYMALAGDQVVTVANGTYDGQITSLAALAHAATGGTYNGWLIIRPETFLGATLDLSDPLSGTYRGGLNLTYDGVGHGFTHLNLRIMLVGFKIVNGMFGPNWIQNLRLWHCDLSWPDTVWQTYYDALYFAAHGTHPTPSPSTNIDTTVFPAASNMYHPTIVGMDQCSYFEAYFTDWHNVGDDALYATGTDNLYTRGCRWDDIYHHGTNYHNVATGNDLIHSDCLQLAGVNWKFKNCSFGGHLDIEGTGAGSVTMNGDNFWQYGSSIPGFGFGTDGSHTVTGALTNGQWFANGQYYHNGGLNPAIQSVPYYDSGMDRLLDAYDPPGLTWDGVSGTSWSAGHHTFPSGVTVVSGSGTAGQNGLLTDLATPLPGTYPNVPSAFSHASNPALIDKAANPWTTWSTFFTGTSHNPGAGTYGWP